MAMFEDTFKGSSLWIGVGLAVAAPVILPAVGAVARPVAKTAIKGYLAAMDTLVPMVSTATTYLGDMLSGVREQVGSMVTEARQEYQSGATGATESATDPGKPKTPEARLDRPRRKSKKPKVQQPADQGS